MADTRTPWEWVALHGSEPTGDPDVIKEDRWMLFSDGQFVCYIWRADDAWIGDMWYVDTVSDGFDQYTRDDAIESAYATAVYFGLAPTPT